MKYKILKGIANDKLEERYQPGDEATLKDWPKKDIEHLIAREAIAPVVTKKKKKATNG